MISSLLLTNNFPKQYMVRKYYWPPPAFLLAKLPNPRIQQQRGEMDSRWTKHVQLVALFDSISAAHHVSVDGDSNFVNNFVKKKTFWKFRLLVVGMFSPWMRFLSSLLSNNSRKVGSYPMRLHFLLQRHPIKSNKSRKWSLWRKPPLIIQNKFLSFFPTSILWKMVSYLMSTNHDLKNLIHWCSRSKLLDALVQDHSDTVVWKSNFC